MKPNPKTQMDTTLKFDGAERENTGRVRGGLHVNRYTGYMNDGREVNKGRGPTTGNNGTQPVTSGTPVTKDAFRRAPAAAVPSLPAQGSVRDSINRGAQVRNPGGTRAWDPKKGQNYAGNPDSIRIGQSGGPNYGMTSKGKTPATRAGSDSFNYGPKSQY
jgi:hypothetical protein